MAKRLKYLYNTDCEVIMDFKIDDKVLSKLDKFVLDFIKIFQKHMKFWEVLKDYLDKKLMSRFMNELSVSGERYGIKV